MASAPAQKVYQFKIILKHSKPPIWRRIQIPADYTFRKLHKSIQSAMGWQSAGFDYHLHKFNFPHGGVSIGKKQESGCSFEFEEEEELDEATELIANHFKVGIAEKATYMYDFGDGWEHQILLEHILPAVPGKQYPVCLTGRRACPPEDCGGILGYYEFLEVLADPSHSEHEERKEWGESQGYDVNGDPGHFDPASVDFAEGEALF